MNWEPSNTRPNPDEIVTAVGSFVSRAKWNAEQNKWELANNETLNAQVNWWTRDLQQCSEQPKTEAATTETPAPDQSQPQ